MDKMKLNKSHRILLWVASGFGLLMINGVFLYCVIFKPELVGEAMGNLYSLVFMLEAFILLPLLCFLISIYKLRSPNWVGFLVLSLLGSLAFSIPFSVLLWTREKDNSG